MSNGGSKQVSVVLRDCTLYFSEDEDSEDWQKMLQGDASKDSNDLLYPIDKAPHEVSPPKSLCTRLREEIGSTDSVHEGDAAEPSGEIKTEDTIAFQLLIPDSSIAKPEIMINSDGEEDAYLDDPEIVAILPRSSTDDQAISKLKEECFEILELKKTLSEEQSFIAEESCLGQKNSGKKQRWTSHNIPGISTPCESSLMDIPKIQMKLGKQKVLAQGECGNSFHVKGKLPVYRKVHVVESTYMCANCGISFSSNEHLTKIPHVHGAEELYSCPNCGANLFQKPLSSGDQIASLGLNPYSCTECDKSFQNDDDLTKHLASHFENTFWCTECEISFGSEYDLQAHCNSHLEGRLFECIKCGNSFGNSFELLLHQQIHTKKVKKPKKPLSKCKQSVNSEQKQYQCTICKKCFSYQSELKIHVTFHEGKTPIRVRSTKNHSLKVQT